MLSASSYELFIPALDEPDPCRNANMTLRRLPSNLRRSKVSRACCCQARSLRGSNFAKAQADVLIHLFNINGPSCLKGNWRWKIALQCIHGNLNAPFSVLKPKKYEVGIYHRRARPLFAWAGIGWVSQEHPSHQRVILGKQSSAFCRCYKLFYPS